MNENAHFRIEKTCAGTLFGWVLFRLSGVGDPVGFVVHTSASRPIARLFRENSGFSENLTRTLGTITCAGRGGVICRPVIPERGLSGASHLVGLTVEGWHSQTTCTAMPENSGFRVIGGQI